VNHLSEHLNQSEGRWLRDLIVLLVLFGALFLVGLGSAPLIDPDEGRYAEIPREMLERGDFVTPTLNYVKYFEKPPLLYWLNAGSMKLFGQNEFAARLPSALAGLFTIIITYSAARTMFNRRTGLLAAIILGSSAGFLMQGRIILTDMLLTCCLTTALFCFLLATRSAAPHKRSFFYLFFIFCGLAVLTKGLIGMVLPAGIVFWFLVIGKRWHLLREIPWFSGLTLFLLVTAPWFILVSLKNPEFPYFFFIHEHFQRYTSTIHHRGQPFWFFLPILVLTMLPWSFFLPGSLTQAWKERYNSQCAPLFLLIWPLVILFFFSFSESKLIPYILPTIPPLALLIAQRCTSGWLQRQSPLRTGTLVLGLLLFIAGVTLALLPLLPTLKPLLLNSGQLARQLADLLYSSTPVLSIQVMATTGLTIALPGLLLLFLHRSRSTLLSVCFLCSFGILLEIMLPVMFTRFAAPRLSPRALAQTAQTRLTPQTVLAQMGPQQGMNFYTGKRLITVGDADELSFGRDQGNQSNWFMTKDQFAQFWQSDRHIMVILKPHEAQQLTSLPTTSHILADNGSLLVLSNR
jgi:4-amino-4-deoxy-L-arabinose transferase-like glycosyltransferase